MSGNVWEFTATVLEDLNEAVICVGSFDNPYRAVQASSKGTYRRRGGQQCCRLPMRPGPDMTTPRDMPARRATAQSGGQRFGRVIDRRPSGSGPGGRMGTYFVRDDETGTTWSFDYSDIVTEGCGASPSGT